MFKKVLSYIVVLQLVSCGNHHSAAPDDVDVYTDSVRCCPEVHICLQPYGKFTVQEARKLAPKIVGGLNQVYAGAWTVDTVLPAKPLPQEAYYKPRNRYLANVLLGELTPCAGTEYVIGLTLADISHRIHGQENYGIMGLTPLGVHKSIVSDYRAKDKNFVAVIVHEFGHGFYAAKHCQDPKCIMCDYQKHKGKPFVFELCHEHMFMN